MIFNLDKEPEETKTFNPAGLSSNSPSEDSSDGRCLQCYAVTSDFNSWNYHPTGAGESTAPPSPTPKSNSLILLRIQLFLKVNILV